MQQHSAPSVAKAFIAAAFLLFAACTVDDPLHEPCLPGQPTACKGPASCPGIRVCQASGQGYSACVCAGGDGSIADAKGTGELPADAPGAEVNASPDGSPPNLDAPAPPPDAAVDASPLPPDSAVADAAARPPDAAVAADGAEPPADAAADVSAPAPEQAADVTIIVPPPPPADAATPPMIAPFQALKPCDTIEQYLVGNTIRVFESSFKYVPPCLKVRPGESVTFWIDASENFAFHTLEPSTRGNAADNPIRETTAGNEVTFAFPKAGFYPFFDKSFGHDDGSPMAGVVWVTDPIPSDGGLPQGELRIVPDLLDVGTVDNYATGPINTLTVQNTGGEAVTSLAISVLNSDFLIPAGGQRCGSTIAAGSSCAVDVQFHPRSSIRERGALTATGFTDGVQVRAVGQLLGHPRLPISLSPPPVPGSFMSAVGQMTVPQTITVTNHGVDPTGPLVFSLTGANASDWIIDVGTCAAPIPGGSTCQFTLAFKPLATGARSAEFSVSARPGGDWGVNHLSGTGN